MAKFDTQYYQGTDQYSDGDIEEEILSIVKEGKSLEESGNRSFAVLYHLSPVRENILSWYPFREGASVLEIGAGPGAITGLLSRKCAEVTSVELSHRRARINYERHRDCGNLTVMVGNLNDMQFPAKFDYVILNGVFEYAGSFTEGEDPYGTFLDRCAGYLKEDGLLLIAIENRIGLKYFAGAPEDHTDNYMEGLKNYPFNSSVHTFSKHEWEEMCGRHGLHYRRFYYPYPDYKFPNEIFTSESLKADGFGRNAWNFNSRRLELFSEQAMGETLCREGVMESFMNSFLIETGRTCPKREQQSEGGEVVYAKMSADRAEQFRIQTVIRRLPDGTKEVIKSPLTPDAAEHLRKMHEREEKAALSGGQPESGCESSQPSQKPVLLRGKLLSDGSLRYPFLEGRSLEEMVEEDPDSVRAAVSTLYSLICADGTVQGEYTDEFTKLFGPARLVRKQGAKGSDGQKAGSTPDGQEAENIPDGQKADTVLGCHLMAAPANIDLIFDNIFPSDEADYVIDAEWVTQTPVPVSFLLWRAVNELYSGRKELEKVLPQAELLKEYGISSSDRQIFWKWASHFEKEYVGANRLSDWALPVRKVDLRDLQWSGEDVRLTASLYLDRGRGFNEEDAVHTEVILEEGRYRADFEIERPQEVRSLRFDPLEGSACICRLHCEGAKLKAMNASALVHGGCVFLTMDPAYKVVCRQIPERLSVSGMVKTRDIHWALKTSQELLKRSKLTWAGETLRRVIRRAKK